MGDGLTLCVPAVTGLGLTSSWPLDLHSPVADSCEGPAPAALQIFPPEDTNTHRHTLSTATLVYPEKFFFKKNKTKLQNHRVDSMNILYNVFNYKVIIDIQIIYLEHCTLKTSLTLYFSKNALFF